MGGGQGQSKIGQESDRALAEISTQLYEMTRGLRGETIGQATEGLTTGDIQARRGEIQSLVEESKAGGADEVQQLIDQFSANGQINTPFAQKQIALARLKANQRTGLVPADYIQAFIRSAEPILYGQAPETAITGLSSLADVSGAAGNSATANQGALIASLLGGAGQIGGAAIAAKYGTPVAATQTPIKAPSSTPLYGSRA